MALLYVLLFAYICQRSDTLEEFILKSHLLFTFASTDSVLSKFTLIVLLVLYSVCPLIEQVDLGECRETGRDNTECGLTAGNGPDVYRSLKGL